jgi:hypothetical protein
VPTLAEVGSPTIMLPAPPIGLAAGGEPP